MGAVMKTKHRFNRSSLPLLATLGLLASACGEAGLADETTGTIDQEIATERPGVVQVAARMYSDPELARVSYAMPDIGGCSATMIGPNTLMTASHCGDVDRDVVFKVYRELDPFQVQTEWFHCRILVNTFYHTDLTLFFCDPNAAGENAGDKYGYLDFDVHAPTVGQAVYSYWHNPVDSLGLTSALLWSGGNVTSTTTTVWSTTAPDSDKGPINRPEGISADLWTQPGCSGSSWLNAANHRVIVGPTSTGVSDARGRNALSMKTYLEGASVDGSKNAAGVWISGVHAATIATFGLTDAEGKYGGKVDKNGNYMFDVQEDIEQRRGENARDVLYLGFESARRNALWSPWYASFAPDSAVARIATPAAFAETLNALAHTKLALAGATRYRVSLRVRTTSSPSPNALFAAFMKGGAVEAQTALPSTPSGVWTNVSFEMTTTSAAPDFVIRAKGGVNAELADVVIVRDGAFDTLDSADDRALFWNPSSGARALVLPDGRTTGAPNWALHVQRDGNRPLGYDWPAASNKLPFARGKRYHVCFQGRGVFPGASGGAVARVMSGGAEVATAPFTTTSAWAETCTPTFTASGDDTSLQFGFATERGPFRIDDIRVIRDISSGDPITPGGGRPGGLGGLGGLGGIGGLPH